MLPEIFSEQQIDFEKFKQLFANEIATHPDRYTLNWAGKSEAYQVLQTPTQQTLIPCEAESVDFAQSQNVFIEGENLEVLKVLQKSYFNSVKMIYIDPPYNTGSDFIYKDNFADSQADYAEKVGDKDSEGNIKRAFVKNSKENGHYHSNWLNMMLPRLHLARNLLRDDGVIFISIDDHEQAQLKLLCDEVFGEENFVEQIIWKKRGSPPNDKKIAAIHEYVLIYAKNFVALNLNLKARDERQLARYSNPDNHPKGKWAADNLMANVKGGRFVKSLYFPIINPNTGEEHFPSSNGNWRFNQEKIKELLKNNEIYFGVDGRGRPKLKRFLCDVKSGVSFGTIWDYVGYNNTASSDFSQVLGNLNIFDTPKPIKLIKEVLELSTDENSIVMDFFAGSATTAHAVMQLNAEDGGNRRFICVQLPEKTDEKSEAFKAGFQTIAEISKERIRRAGKQIAEQYPDKTMDTGFKAFKLSGSHFKQWQSPTEQYLEKQLQMFIDPVAENTDTQAMMYELLLRLGFSLTAKVRWENQVCWVEENHQRVALILNEVNESIINDVMTRQPQKVVMLDRLFNGDDAFKKNTELQMSDMNIALLVI
ncbi:site-specific DNA-methyltransferase [Avibacterium sp. 20-126]|uniref:site-specific DNA-methyltransferase n=1 Tax=Avibacterium sp. 20-126 TaxID=2911524 RepID=UPI0037BE5102